MLRGRNTWKCDQVHRPPQVEFGTHVDFQEDIGRLQQAFASSDLACGLPGWAREVLEPPSLRSSPGHIRAWCWELGGRRGCKPSPAKPHASSCRSILVVEVQLLQGQKMARILFWDTLCIDVFLRKKPLVAATWQRQHKSTSSDSDVRCLAPRSRGFLRNPRPGNLSFGTSGLPVQATRDTRDSSTHHVLLIMCVCARASSLNNLQTQASLLLVMCHPGNVVGARRFWLNGENSLVK